MYGPQAARALLAIYEADRRGSVPMMAASFIDVSAELDDTVKVAPFAVISEHVKIGRNTTIWAGARILAGAQLGYDVSIGGGTEVGRESIIGNGTRIGANCFLPSKSRIYRNVFIGPNVSCADDRFPRVRLPEDGPYFAEPPVIQDGAVIGLGAVLLPGVTIGERAFVAAGAVVTHDVAARTAVAGVPARVVGLSSEATDEFWRKAAS